MADNTNGKPVRVQLPSRAVADDGADVLEPVKELLRGLSLLGTPSEQNEADGFAAALHGPPQSVALIESGATALTKWWAAGLGASVTALWAGLAAWWNAQQDPTQVAVIWSGAVATAAAILAIGVIISADVRGRSAASVATIDARSALAAAMVQAAQAVHGSTEPPNAAQLVPLAPPISVKWTAKPAAQESGWSAVALMSDGTGGRYLLAKGADHEWVPLSEVETVKARSSAKT